MFRVAEVILRDYGRLNKTNKLTKISLLRYIAFFSSLSMGGVLRQLLPTQMTLEVQFLLPQIRHHTGMIIVDAVLAYIVLRTACENYNRLP